MPYYNSVTLISRTPIEKVAKERLLVLDNYAFDINEFIAYASQNVGNIIRNPHRPYPHDKFSDAAKQKIRDNPRLASLISDEDEYDSEDEAMAQGEEAYDNYLANRGPD